ncbi:type I-C CRISPR-associated protein Cas7/Csd2 [Solobacterium sp.]|uniref:type I-C CRISPR-associated protein Cas7/Csd2 n=1 Tax=Solobacterium sp. TaxID=2060878 RepID=UPI001CAFD4D0|nr:type I-C CRISPR-associated protein Cas7/Csd2 [Solobacterium sp.]MBF1085411.1 type I-C CRISPR-associated protein Cas7/Csd2 [Solobacterium sp.]
MSTLNNKIDFTAIISVHKANPNGDPLNGNRPREDYAGHGEISDVCIKRKIRNRLQDMGERIFVQSQDRSDDGAKSLKERADRNMELKEATSKKNKELFAEVACKTWTDVRTFGQVFAFKGDSLSVGIRGPVSIQVAESVNPISINQIQITKSVNGETKDGEKASDTMGTKSRVEFGLYVIRGSINCQLAEKTGFCEKDADNIKEALRTLFENDASSARPDGSMEVKKIYWWRHNCKSGQYSSAKVQNTISIKLKDNIENPTSFEDYDVVVNNYNDLSLEIIDGM